LSALDADVIDDDTLLLPGMRYSTCTLPASRRRKTAIGLLALGDGTASAKDSVTLSDLSAVVWLPAA
jgi:hypothetical protein